MEEYKAVFIRQCKRLFYKGPDGIQVDRPGQGDALHDPVKTKYQPNDHLTDFIAVPVMAHLALTVTRRFIVRDDTYPLSYLLFIALYVSVILEGVLPRLSSRYTSDWRDVAAYFGGSLFYYFYHPKSTVFFSPGFRL